MVLAGLEARCIRRPRQVGAAQLGVVPDYSFIEAFAGPACTIGLFGVAVMYADAGQRPT